MQREAEANLPASARQDMRGGGQSSGGWVGRALSILGPLWVVLLLGFGLYYIVDQKSRQVAPGQGTMGLEIQRAEEAVRRAPDNPTARIAVADLYAEAGRFQDSAGQYLQVLQMDPKNLPAANGLASAYLRMGRSEEALPVLQKAIQDNQELKVVRTSADMGEAHLRSGQILLSQGKVVEARSEAEMAQRNLPADADVLLLLGRTLAQSGDLVGAVECYRSALSLVPRFPEAYEALESAYEDLGDRPRAAYARAMVIYSRGEYAGAAQELEALVREEPAVGEARLGLGMAYERLGKTGQAVAEYEEALRLDPSLDYARARLTARTGE